MWEYLPRRRGPMDGTSWKPRQSSARSALTAAGGRRRFICKFSGWPAAWAPSGSNRVGSELEAGGLPYQEVDPRRLDAQHAK